MVSVVRASTAAWLGIDLETGEPIDLAGVGGHLQRFYLHRLEARLADLPPFTFRVAFAGSEDVPNLLGRLDVLDRFGIHLDPGRSESRFSLP